MKIKKNGKVIRLTESDLKRIVKRTLKEAAYTEMEQQNTEIPSECTKSHLEKVMRFMSESNSEKIKIQTGTDAGFTGSIGKDVLIITDPIGKVCGCLKKDFFDGGV